MLRTALGLICYSLVLTGCIFLGDRVLQVKVQVVTEDGSSLRGCAMGLHSATTNEAIDTKDDLRPEYLTTFVNPPMRGTYYFKISCPSRRDTYKSDVHDFATPPYLYDLGKVVIKG